MTINLSYPVIFTYLGFHINSLVDQGEHFSYEEMLVHCEKRTVWTLLEEKLGKGRLDLYSELQREELSDYFESCANAIDAERKLGITQNGYCLLVAYLFEAVQNGKESGWFRSLTSK